MEGFEAALPHQSAHPPPLTGDLPVGQFDADPAVPVTAEVGSENGFDDPSCLFIGSLCGGGPRGVIVTISWHRQGGTDDPDGQPGGPAQIMDHLMELAGPLVTRMTAAFFKMSFSN
jgi:hypothetical protein